LEEDAETEGEEMNDWLCVAHGMVIATRNTPVTQIPEIRKMILKRRLRPGRKKWVFEK
jgi:hypothetical protein